MNSILEAVILGAVQGITEWLPISSSGHLVLFQKWLGLEVPVIYDIVLHLGSLLVVFLVFWKDIQRLIVGVVKREPYFVKYFIWLMLATIPIGLVGVFLNGFVKQAFGSVAMAGYGFLFTAVIVFLSQYPREKNKSPTWISIVGMGALQALAILPGVSRSGMTISAGLMQGVEREQAARFSFLLFIPAIVGAIIVEFKNISQIEHMGSLLIGVVVTVITGYLSIRLLLRIVKQGHFHYFAWYCLAVGLLVLLAF